MTATPIHLPNIRLLTGWLRGLGATDADEVYVAHAVFHRVEALCECADGGVDLGDLPPLIGAALAAGPSRRRRAFAMLDGATPWPLPPELGESFAPAGVWRFDPAGLAACVGRDDAWKAAHGFPADVAALIRPSADNPDSVLLDGPRQARLVILRTAAETRGYAVPREDSPEPPRAAFRCPNGGGWLSTLVGGEERPNAWREAWLSWSKPRGVPVTEAESCAVEAAGSVLTVRGPARTLDRLRQARGDAWILAGDGRARRAARLELRPGERGA